MPCVTIRTAQYFYQISSDQIVSKLPVLILLHGSGGDSSVWEKQIDGFGREVAVIAPDLPGHGQSDGPLRTTVNDYAVWLNNFVQQLQINRFFLAGHSLGGAIAQEYARRFPQKVQGLILAGSGTQFIVAADYLETVKNNFSAAVHASCQAAYAAGNISSLYEKGYGMLSRNGKDALCSDLALCSAFDSTAWVSSIAVPVLVICGSDDKITPPESSQSLARLISGAQLKIVAGAGHMVMMEAATEFNEAIKTFIMRTTGITESLCDLKQSNKVGQCK
jgi:pimeloyl-ACP methyl ester carboxylesterase